MRSCGSPSSSGSLHLFSRHPVAPERAVRERKGGVALLLPSTQHISCKFMQSSGISAAVQHGGSRRERRRRPARSYSREGRGVTRTRRAAVRGSRCRRRRGKAAAVTVREGSPSPVNRARLRLAGC
ncbi:hypothetical protein FQA47_025042 [Oryzias melastigma]|uniref:Uncharacterized protein n=1 Tax=Oryzias melastigma TaxID=30732 RepID=A0A834CRG5_ORYME|nr:hypothetical protein FQA47_025042 [Oryzias melastigma]